MGYAVKLAHHYLPETLPIRMEREHRYSMINRLLYWQANLSLSLSPSRIPDTPHAP